MNAAKQFYSQNSGLVQNVVYVLAVGIVCYMVYTYLTAGSDDERYVIQVNMSDGVYGLPGNSSNAAIPVAGVKGQNRTQYCLNYDESLTADKTFVPNPILRIKEGNDFTFSWWMYINTWDASRMGVIKPILTISDPNVSNLGRGGDAAYIMSTFLYPNSSKLGIRFHTRPTAANDLTWMKNFTQNATNAATAQQTFHNSGSTPVCDINDIDMQRWLNFTCVVSGRVVDIYYDGKLNRSCVLPGPVVGSAGTSKQSVNTSVAGGFNGFLNGVFFAGHALTPDRIYGLYQAGPQGTTSIVRALFQKLGIKLNYNGTSNWQRFL
jgi:hypothetical protein